MTRPRRQLPRPGGWDSAWAPLALAGMLLGALLLLAFPPAQYGFYPACPIRSLLDIDCPGCGSTRAMAALLRGDLAAAFRLNAMATCAVPAFAMYAAVRSVEMLVGRTVLRMRVPRAVLPLSFGVVALFTLIRNL